MTLKSKSGARRDPEEMLTLMKAFESSGQSQRLFWEAHGLPRSTFQYWWRRYRQSKSSGSSGQGGFIPLEIKSGTALSVAGVVITYTDGIRVELPVQVGASFIRQLLDR